MGVIHDISIIILYEGINIYKGEEGTGKSIRYLNINYKKIYELLFLFLIYGILFQCLIFITALLSWELALLFYAINMIIIWEVFIKPLLKEMRII